MLPEIPPYKTKVVEPVYFSTKEERKQWIAENHYNLFNLKRKQVIIDLLTDSGTSAMSDKQWSEMMLGDESYAGSESFDKLKASINEILGFKNVLPTHQGRAAENVVMTALVKEGDIVPGNSHFDTTKGHIEFRKARAIDCTIDDAFDTEKEHPFKGNICLQKLEDVLKSNPKEKIPFVLITVTCNTTGGQPVSLENINAVKSLCKKYDIKVFFDIARYAENAYFIKEREESCKGYTIKEIIKKMFEGADGAMMSSKKDALVNIGGFIALNSSELFQKCSMFTIVFEGYLTYGGLAGRDLAALAQGLHETADYDYLHARISQVAYLGNKLKGFGIPVQQPFGGHAIFIDALKFFPNLLQSEYIAQLLAVEAYIEGGVRGVEIGTILADRDPETRENRYPKLELVRLAIPRRVYSKEHMDYIAETFKMVYNKRASYKAGFEITWEAEVLRHFTVKLKRK